MNQRQLNKLFSDVNKKSPNNNNWFTAINLTNSYLTNFFTGTEHDLLKKKYANYLFAYILEFLNSNRSVNELNFNPNTINDFITDIRRDTYNFRKNIFYRWINCISEKRQHASKLVQSLLTFFPSITNIKEVRTLLGLNYNVI